MKKEEYSEFLKHPLWEQKRQEIFVHYGKRCKKCGAKYNLQVHHKTYSNGKMPWEYPIENFEILCEKCHSKTHGFRYEDNKCRECGRTISAQFVYCLGCHNSLKERKEKEKAELEFKIEGLEKALYREQNRNKERDEKISNHESVVKQLLSEKGLLETKINETKAQMSQRLKEEKRQKDKTLKEVESLVNEKESLEIKINELQTRISNNSRNDGSFSQEKKILNGVNKKLNETKAQMSQRLKEEKRIKNQKSHEIEQLLREKESLVNKINETEAQMSQRLKEEKNIRDQKRQKIERLLNERSTLEKERIEIVEVIKEMQNLNNIDSDKREAENNAFKGSILTQINHLKKIAFLLVFLLISALFATAFFLKNDFEKSPEAREPIASLSKKAKAETKIISIESLDTKIGKNISIEAIVTQVVMAENGNLYLNMGGRYPNQKLTLVAFPENVFLIPEPEKYEGTTIIAQGKLSLYNGKPQIIIDKPGQIIRN